MDHDKATEIRELLSYPENSAGGIMTTEFARVPPEVTAAEAIELLRDQEPEVETVYYIYVIDKRERLLGVISLRDLLTVPGGRRVRDFMSTEPISVSLEAGEEEVTRDDRQVQPPGPARGRRDRRGARHSDDRRRHRPRAAPGLEETIAAHLPVTR